MFSWFKKSKVKTAKKVSDDEWAQLITKFDYLQKLDEATVKKLRILVDSVLNKAFLCALGSNIERSEVLLVTTQASVLVLNLGEEWLNGWDSVLLDFDNTSKLLVNNLDNFGVSYLPVISATIDSLNGERNGLPPLHASLNKKQWLAIFNDAMDDFKNRIASGPKNEILFDLSAADNLANFFSIMSEVFFIAPDTIRCAYPDVYQQLMLFYRQNTAVQQNMNTNNAYKSLFTK